MYDGSFGLVDILHKVEQNRNVTFNMKLVVSMFALETVLPTFTFVFHENNFERKLIGQYERHFFKFKKL